MELDLHRHIYTFTHQPRNGSTQHPTFHVQPHCQGANQGVVTDHCWFNEISLVLCKGFQGQRPCIFRHSTGFAATIEADDVSF